VLVAIAVLLGGTSVLVRVAEGMGVLVDGTGVREGGTGVAVCRLQ
jgi:hypothetical protein